MPLNKIALRVERPGYYGFSKRLEKKTVTINTFNSGDRTTIRKN
jgi:hypothetical protein